MIIYSTKFHMELNNFRTSIPHLWVKIDSKGQNLLKNQRNCKHNKRLSGMLNSLKAFLSLSLSKYPGRGSNPYDLFGSQDFKSCVSLLIINTLRNFIHVFRCILRYFATFSAPRFRTQKYHTDYVQFNNNLIYKPLNHEIKSNNVLQARS